MFRCGKCGRMHELAEGKCICGNDLLKNSVWVEDEPEPGPGPIPPEPDPVNRGGGGSGPGPTPPDPDPVNPGSGGHGSGLTPPDPGPVNPGGGWSEPELTPPAPRPKKGKIVKRVLLVLLILFLVVIAAAAGAYLADSAGTDGNRDGQSSGTGDSLGEEDPGNAGPSDEGADNDEETGSGGDNGSEETGHMLAAGGVDLNGPDLDEEDICVINFEDSLENAPEDAWDVSAEGDGSVLAWAELIENFYALHIGSEGGVIANPIAEGYFKDYSNLISIYFNDNFDTSYVVNMSGMFWMCRSLTSLELTGFNTSFVEDMSYMFYFCDSLSNLDLSTFDTSNVRNMKSMFESCFSLTSLDLSHFDSLSLGEIDYMFAWCENLTELDVSSLDARLVATSEGVFEGMPREQEYENYFRSEYDKVINESMNNE